MVTILLVSTPPHAVVTSLVSFAVVTSLVTSAPVGNHNLSRNLTQVLYFTARALRRRPPARRGLTPRRCRVADGLCHCELMR